MLLLIHKWLKWLIAFFACLLLATYYRRNPTGDDAWFAEQSYWLWKSGYFRSSFFDGFLGWGKQIYVCHKLFLAVGSLLMSWGGISVYVSKSIGVIFLGLLILFFKKYFHSRIKSFWWLMLLLFANGLVAQLSFENRPEMMLGTLGFGSFYFLQKEENKLIYIILAAILASLATLAHLNGVIYLMGGVFFLITQQQWKKAILFTVMGAGVASLYFYDVWQNHAFEIWSYQFINDPATKESFELRHKLQVMATFPKIFFTTGQVIVLTVLVGVISFFGKKWLKQHKVWAYLCLIILSFWLVTKSTVGIYQMLFLPFMMVLAVEIFTKLKNTHTKIPNLIVFAFFIYLLVGLIDDLKLIYRNHTQAYLPETYNTIAQLMPKGSKAIVPLTFFFNHFPEYQLQGQSYYYLINKMDFQEKMTDTFFFQLAQNSHNQFVLFDYEDDYAAYYPPKNTKNVNEYQLIFTDSRFNLYQLK